MIFQLPAPDPNWALFVDFDGTLVEIVDQPDSVTVPAQTKAALFSLHRALGGALAVISGRRIADLDRFLELPELAAAGLHGFERREADHRVERPDASASVAVLRDRIAPLLAAHPGARLEDKGASLALHWREAPQHGEALAAAMRHAAEDLGDLSLVAGKMVIEAKPAGVDKGLAIERFMRTPPFAGRVPVFAGDDVTDEYGFAAVEAQGGITIKVGDGETRAHYRSASVGDFNSWLAEVASALEGRRVHS